jgi:hypothetical protein
MKLTFSQVGFAEGDTVFIVKTTDLKYESLVGFAFQLKRTASGAPGILIGDSDEDAILGPGLEFSIPPHRLRANQLCKLRRNSKRKIVVIHVS